MVLLITASTSSELSMEEGDLIQLSKPAGQEALTSPHCRGKNMRTDQEGSLPSSELYVLATQTRPTQQHVVSASHPHSQGYLVQDVLTD